LPCAHLLLAAPARHLMDTPPSAPPPAAIPFASASSHSPLDRRIAPMLAAGESGGVADSARLLSLDTCRAIALLGIFFVNAHFFGSPFNEAIDPGAPEGESAMSLAVYWFTMIFCSGKFYPLFSLLFGVGLAVIFSNRAAANRSFAWPFLRRILMLAIFGILHIVLLWNGDILLIYATVGVWMLLLGRFSARVLLIVAACTFGFGLLFSTGAAALFTSLGSMAPPPAGEPPVLPAGTPFEQWLYLMGHMQAGPESADPRMAELEIAILQNGPFADAMKLRCINYLFMMVFVVLFMFWHVLAMFCTGAALLKMGFFHGGFRRLRMTFIATGLLVGLPLSLVGVFMGQNHPQEGAGAAALANLVTYVCGPLVSLMYLSLVITWVQSGRALGVARTLANLGRMGLTGYLLESTLMSVIMLHWGLARFGNTTWAERGVYVVAIYLVILLIANIWMRLFRFGPLEWIWRTVTYLKAQPLLRSGRPA
jgi:uncharacterized protein